MSYDFDILAATPETRNEARARLVAFLANRENYEHSSNEHYWTPPGTEDALVVGIVSEDAHDDPELEDDPRSIGWISFNYFRDDIYYSAVVDEIKAIQAVGPFELFDPQTDSLWTDGIDDDVVMESVEQVHRNLPSLTPKPGFWSRLFGRKD